MALEKMTREQYIELGMLGWQDLFWRRDWTRRMQRKLLGKPDQMIRLKPKPDPPYDVSEIWPTIGLWRADRVALAEATPEWKKMREKADRRKETSYVDALR
jgi:hypothetical protein